MLRAALIALIAAAIAGGAAASGKDEKPELAAFRIFGGNPPRHELVRLQTDGTIVRLVVGDRLRVGRPALFTHIAWSPDGERLAFEGEVPEGVGDRSFRREVFVVDADGSNLRRLTHTGGLAAAPVWSPDRRTIAFARLSHRLPHSPVTTTATIWLVNADGSQARPLLPATPNRLDIPGSWSPDGSRLAFTRSHFPLADVKGRVRDIGSIFVVGRDGAGLRRLAVRAAGPSWSPDGKTIAFVSDRAENGRLSYGEISFFAGELYRVGADGGRPRRITDTRELNERTPAWTPDGTLLAYTRGRQFQNAEAMSLMTIAPDGTRGRVVFEDPRFDVWMSSPAWRPQG